MMTIPSSDALYGLYAFWGVSTILPFWSALIRATRDWGGAQQQGRAFGMLDAGRGLLAAVLATFALLLFASSLPGAEAEITLVQKTRAIQITIATYVAACLVAATMIWLCLPRTSRSEEKEGAEESTADDSPWLSVLRMPAVWLQAIVIVGAYCTFKGIDYYSQYAKDIWGWSDVESSTLSTLSTWMRPIATVAAGFIADRFYPSRTIIAAFAIVALGSLSMVFMTPNSLTADGGGALVSAGSPVWLLWATILIGCLGIFALRGIYFALLEESRVPLRVTGTAVGVVSFIGYTPELCMPHLGGMLIGGWDGGITGYRVFFGILILACLVGTRAAWRLRRLAATRQAKHVPG